MSNGKAVRKTREFGGYAARGKPVEQLPRVPSGPAPGYRRHQTSDPIIRSAGNYRAKGYAMVEETSNG